MAVLNSLGITPRQVLMALLLWLLVVLLTACGTVASVAGPEAQRFVSGYCALATPAERALLRSQVNAQLAPNSIAVICADELDAPAAGDQVRM